MSDRMQPFKESTALTRRDFTLDAALALLAGCMITVTDACGSSSNTSPTAPSPTPSPTPADVNGTVSANHGHTAVVAGAQITAGNAIVLDIRGMATHNHTVSLSQTDLQTLRNRQPVSRDSSTDNSHMHTVTFTPA